MMDNVQNYDGYINIPSSQTYNLNTLRQIFLLLFVKCVQI
jgi:hypothetical protein